jgi:hypothetical protein
VGDEKTNVSEPLSEASIDGTMVPKAGSRIVPVTKARRFGAPSAWRRPACWPGGARCRGGVSSSQALVRNRRTSRPDAVGQSKWVWLAPWSRKGGPQVATTARGRVPMRGTGTGRLVVAMKVL